MFGHDSLPSIVLTYGCTAPSENRDAANEQYSLAHKYRNALVEMERTRREEVRSAIAAAAPDLLELEDVATKLQAEVAVKLAAMKQENAESRSRAASKQMRSDLSELRARVKAAWKAVKARKAELYADPKVKTALKAIDDVSNTRHKAIRAESGVYYGTYLAVDNAHQQARSSKAPPKFQRWTGDGKIGVQVQGGLGIDELFAGTDTRVQLHLYDDHPTKPHIAGKVRISSDAKGKPIWAVVKARLHRPLPAGSRVKWAYLIRRRVAATDHYSLQLTVSAAGGFDKTDRATTGMVAVNLGWRQVDGGIRVATWVGSDKKSGEVLIDDTRIRQRTRCDDLESVRDTRFNSAMEILLAWMRREPAPDALAADVKYFAYRAADANPKDRERLSMEHGAWARLASNWERTSDLTEWFVERTKTAGQWRSQARLASLLLHWRENRFDGDEYIYQALEAWRKRDKHLWQWAAHQRRAFSLWRLDYYRNVAAQLRRSYATIALEDTDYRPLARRPDVTSDDPVIEAARYNRNVASPGLLRRILTESGPRAQKIDAAYITQTCRYCGHVEAFDAIKSIMRECPKCNAIYDQDRNAAANLLASGAVV